MHSSLVTFPSFKFYNASMEAGMSEEKLPMIGLHGINDFWPNEEVNCVFIDVCGQEVANGGDFTNEQ